MKYLKIIFLLAFVMIGASVFAQERQDNSFAPMSKEQSATQKKAMKKRGKKSNRAMFNKRMNQKVKEYEKRMVANAKQDRKERRLAKKPQYSDPSYFGHKKKPKKRPVGKRKFCKECHIWH